MSTPFFRDRSDFLHTCHLSPSRGLTWAFFSSSLSPKMFGGPNLPNNEKNEKSGEKNETDVTTQLAKLSSTPQSTRRTHNWNILTTYSEIKKNTFNVRSGARSKMRIQRRRMQNFTVRFEKTAWALAREQNNFSSFNLNQPVDEKGTSRKMTAVTLMTATLNSIGHRPRVARLPGVRLRLLIGDEALGAVTAVYYYYTSRSSARRSHQHILLCS